MYPLINLLLYLIIKCVQTQECVQILTSKSDLSKVQLLHLSFQMK